MKLNEKSIKKTMEKGIKKREKENVFSPDAISLKKLCNTDSNPEYFGQIRNRIYWEMEKDESLSDYVYLNKEDLTDIALTEDGLIKFYDILKCYFDTETLDNVIVFMNGLNVNNQVKHELIEMFSGCSISQLEGAIEVYDSYFKEENRIEEEKRLLPIIQEALDIALQNKKQGRLPVTKILEFKF